MADSRRDEPAPSDFTEDPELRKILQEWAASAPPTRHPSLQAALRQYLARESLGDSDQVVPVGGELWLRRQGGKNPLPVRSRTEAAPGDALFVPAGGLARLRCVDGSEIVLREQSVLVLEDEKEVERHRYHLLRGEAYVRVVPRESSKSAFGISTPAGSVKVMGTEFSVSLMPDKLMRVLVKTGQVLVTTDAGGQKLRHNEEIIAGPTTLPQPRRLPQRRVRSETRWAETNAASRKKILALLATAIVLGLLGAFLLFYREPFRVSDETLAALQPAKETPKYLNGQLIAPGEVVTFDATNQNFVNNEWQQTSTMQLAFELLEQTNEGSRLRVTFLGYKPKAFVSQYMRDFADLAGWSFEYAVNTDGAITIEKLGVEEPMQGAAAIIAMTALHYSPHLLLESKELLPGDEWGREGSVTISDTPHAFMSTEATLRFDQWVEHNGRTMARIIEESTGELGGMTLRIEEKQPGMHYSLVRRPFTRRTTWLVDAATGRLVGGLLEEENSETYFISGADNINEAMNLPAREEQQGRPQKVRTWFDVSMDN